MGDYADFEGADYERSFEDAVIPASGSNYTMELRALYYLHSNLAAQLAHLQDDYVTFPQTTWQVTGVEIKPFKELDDRYAENCFWGILDFVDQPGGAFAFVDLAAAEMLTGLPADDLATNEGQEYVEVWMNHLAQQFMGCWEEIARFDVQMFPSPTAPTLADMQAMFPGLNHNTPIIATAFRVALPGQAAVARVTLGIPQAYLLAVGQSLQAVGEATFSSNDTSHFYERLAYVEDVPVPVSVMLGRTEMTVGDLQGLEEGDVIELDTTVGLPLEVRIGSTVMQGKPGTTTDGRRLAVQIVRS